VTDRFPQERNVTQAQFSMKLIATDMNGKLADSSQVPITGISIEGESWNADRFREEAEERGVTFWSPANELLERATFGVRGPVPG
jgi:hypothetical protein